MTNEYFGWGHWAAPGKTEKRPQFAATRLRITLQMAAKASNTLLAYRLANLGISERLTWGNAVEKLGKKTKLIRLRTNSKIIFNEIRTSFLLDDHQYDDSSISREFFNSIGRV
ncbi:MAG: hypothetical protein AAFR51_17115 [Pseudomonadota bacterium]